MLWEAVTLRLAALAGINASRSELYDVDGKDVLVLERFDRVGGRRIGYVSARTMLARTNDDVGSYLEMAEVIAQVSPQATEDLRQLWRRIAFSVLISNFDDHLRNHGFLRTSTAGWTLAPAFDMNPDPRPGPRRLHTAIDLHRTDASTDLILGVAGEFRLSGSEARELLSQVYHATAQWRTVARELGATAAEIDQLKPAFEHHAAAQARSLVVA